MQLKRTRVRTQIATLCLILPNLSKAERNHSDTNFNQCLEQNTIKVGKLGEGYRKQELERIKKLLIHKFPDKKNDISKNFKEFTDISAKDPSLQEKSESLSHFLNELYNNSKSDPTKKSSLYNLWLKYNSPNKRSSLGIGRSDRCIQGLDSNFKALTPSLKTEVRRLLSGHNQSRQVLSALEQVNFQPAGSKAYFGATADYANKKARICINPEEAIPLLIPKLIHELTHVNSIKLRNLKQLFSSAAAHWQSFHMQKDQAEAELYDFEENIKKQHLASLETDNLLPKLKSKNLKGFDEVFTELSKMQKENPYTQKETISRRSHSMKLVKFISLRNKSDELLKKMEAARTNYDIERFYDEHRAYIREYSTAVYLSKNQPKIFCKIWVPSFAQKRPVRFFEAYLELESRLLSGKFSSWLADLYTFETKSYVPSSLYQDENKKKIKEEVLASAQSIIYSQLKGEKLLKIR